MLRFLKTKSNNDSNFNQDYDIVKISVIFLKGIFVLTDLIEIFLKESKRVELIIKLRFSWDGGGFFFFFKVSVQLSNLGFFN